MEQCQKNFQTYGLVGRGVHRTSRIIELGKLMTYLVNLNTKCSDEHAYPFVIFIFTT